MSSFPSISVRELAKLADERSIDLIDVRTPAEFHSAHAAPARNQPLDRLDPRQIIQARNAEQGSLYLICQSGNRSTKACQKFRDAGYDDIVNVEGGTKAWVDAGLPVVEGKKTISLDRQVRIAAGTLVLLGAGLGFWVHPAFLGLSAFVGAGLAFAGITDTCGMALLLGKMPWNQVHPACETKSCSR